MRDNCTTMPMTFSSGRLSRMVDGKDIAGLISARRRLTMRAWRVSRSTGEPNSMDFSVTTTHFCLHSFRLTGPGGNTSYLPGSGRSCASLSLKLWVRWRSGTWTEKKQG